MCVDVFESSITSQLAKNVSKILGSEKCLTVKVGHPNDRIIPWIRRLKSLQDTSNKLRQEKWVDEKTKRIKEQTVRGLEPEIQRLLARHNAEIADLEAERERRLTSQERELHQRHLQHVRDLRTQEVDTATFLR